MKELKCIRIKLPLLLEVVDEREIFNPSKREEEEWLIIKIPIEALELEEED